MFEHFLSKAGLSVERLHALLLLKEHGALIRAAGGDPNKQTRLSHYLRELSGFMGTPLTKREGRSIRLTAAGEELVELVRSQFQSLLEFQSRSAGAVRQVRIGAGDSLLQWLLIPSLGALRSMGVKQKVALENLRTADLTRCIQEQRLDFAIMRENAVTAEMASTPLGVVRHVIVVPRKFASRRMNLRAALLDFPHVTVGGDGELVQKLRSLATDLRGTFQPELFCSSIGQCIAALRSGTYAAVLPTQAWEQIAGLDCEVISDGLADLDRPVVLAWSPRNIEAFGASLERFKGELTEALLEEARRIGLVTDP
jgi:DNA-binding transcriptional LysR family regulator